MHKNGKSAIRFGGVNHLAMVTGDMDKTVRFYRDILGLRLVATTGNSRRSYPFRHYFFEIGPGSTLAFFEWPGMVTKFKKPAGLPVAGSLQFDHLSLNVADEEALLALRDRLAAHGVEVTRVVDHTIIQSIYFHDPSGIALEASYWVKDPTGHEPAWEDPDVFGDPEPVAALREEMAHTKA